MDSFVTDFFTTATLVFVVGVSVIVLFVRKIVERSWGRAAGNPVWGEFILPALPVLLAVLIAAFAKKYPYPAAFAGSLSARIFYGLVCGAFSDLIYGKIKKVIKAATGSSGYSIPPAALPPTNPPPQP